MSLSQLRVAVSAFALILTASNLSVGQAFVVPRATNVVVAPPNVRLTSLHAKATLPKYDNAAKRWSATCEEEGYGPAGSLLRFGPVPFIKRLSEPDAYEQAVLKYQATAKCSRMEAQGNMDAYFENVNDWVVQKFEEKNGRPERDYVTLDRPKLVLTLTWAVLVTSVLGAMVHELYSGGYCLNHPDTNFCRVFF